MKIFSVLLSTLVLGNIAHASLNATYEASYGKLPVPKIGLSYQMEKLNKELLENLYGVEVAAVGNESISKVNDLLNFAGKCDNFATVKDMGQWGDLILNEMKRNRYSELYRGAPDLTEVCPNFSKMSDDGREVVWVMVVNAMAHLESSCTLGIPAKGPNGALIGLLQLHNGAEQRYGKYCKKGDGKTAEGTFRCGLSMLEGQLSRDNSLFSRKSYWDVLRPQAKSQKYLKIQKALKNLSICKIGSAQVEPQASSLDIKNVPVPTPRPVIEAPKTEETKTTEVGTETGSAPTTIEEVINGSL